MKKINLLLVLALLFSPAAYAAMEAGNAMCPVSGDKVSGKDFAEAGGKNYGLCCAMCAGKLAKNPEKYLGEEAAAEGSHEGHHHDM